MIYRNGSSIILMYLVKTCLLYKRNLMVLKAQANGLIFSHWIVMGISLLLKNKGDSSGKDVVWQNLKYVSYCSTLTKSEIIDIHQLYLDKYKNGEKALDNLLEFFGVEDIDEVVINEDQRIFFVALNYRKEVTSTVMWLLGKGIDVKCFKVSMYYIKDELFMDFEQIIPVKEAQDYTISMNKKANDISVDKKKTYALSTIRNDYWRQMLEILRSSNTSLFKNISPSKDHWLSCGSGISGIEYCLLAGVSFAGVELAILKPTQEQNKEIFDKLYSRKAEIEGLFGDVLDWRRLDDKKSCRIVYQNIDVSVKNKEDWKVMQEFHMDSIIRLEKAFKPYLVKLK